MKVKIGTTIFDANIEPIMIIFDDDKERISTANTLLNMETKKEIRKFCMYPTKKYTQDFIKKFMNLNQN